MNKRDDNKTFRECRMSQLTDKEVFDFFNRLFPGGINKIYENKKGGLVIDIDNLCDQIFTNTQGITWSHTSRQYPPPAEKLEPCRYCKKMMHEYTGSDGNKTGELVHPYNPECPWSSKVVDKVNAINWPKIPPPVKKLQTCWYCNAEFVNNGDGSNDWFVHPEDDNCPISGFDIEVKKLPKIPATNKESLLVQNVDGAPQCKRCKGSGKIPTDLHRIDCSDCGGSGIARDTIPSLESLGLDPGKVWENAPIAVKIELREKLSHGRHQAVWIDDKNKVGVISNSITIPPGTDWKKCIWKRL